LIQRFRCTDHAPSPTNKTADFNGVAMVSVSLGVVIPLPGQVVNPFYCEYV
jgi:hypothetical protein